MKGVLPLLISARKLGFKNFIIPIGNKLEASYITGINVYCTSSLKETIEFLRGEKELEEIKPCEFNEIKTDSNFDMDFCNVKGQAMAKELWKLLQLEDTICL